MRQYSLNYAELYEKLESFMLNTNMQFWEMYQALTELASKEEVRKNELTERNPIGFKLAEDKEE